MKILINGTEFNFPETDDVEISFISDKEINLSVLTRPSERLEKIVNLFIAKKIGFAQLKASVKK